MAEPMTAARLAEIEARAAAATPAESWPGLAILDLRRPRNADEELAFHAFADVPDLVAEVRRLRRIERLLQATEGYPEVLRAALDDGEA